MIRIGPSTLNIYWSRLACVDVGFRYDIDDGKLLQHNLSYPPWSEVICFQSRLLLPFLTGKSTDIAWARTFLFDRLFLYDRYHTPSPSAGTLPKADAVLVNGLGRFAGGPASPLAVITVIPHKRYRFRLISMSCDPNFTFNIDGHTMVRRMTLFS